MCTVVYIDFPSLLLRFSLTTLHKIANLYWICSIYLQTLHSSSSCYLFLAPGLTRWTTSMDSLTLLASYCVWPVGRPEGELREDGESGYLFTLSLKGQLGLAESLGLRSQYLSESFSIQSSISPPSSDFSLLLTFQDLGVITESCCTLSFMVYLYPAYTFVNSSLRKHFSKYPIWVLHLPRPWLSETASHHNSPYSSSLPYFSP